MALFKRNIQYVQFKIRHPSILPVLFYLHSFEHVVMWELQHVEGLHGFSHRPLGQLKCFLYLTVMHANVSLHCVWLMDDTFHIQNMQKAEGKTDQKWFLRPLPSTSERYESFQQLVVNKCTTVSTLHWQMCYRAATISWSINRKRIATILITTFFCHFV